MRMRVDEANRKGLAAEDDDCGGGVSRGVEAESEADSDGQGGGDVAGQGSVEAHVHERVAIGNATADLDDGAGGAAEGGSGQNPGQRSADAVKAAGEVVAELVDEQDAQQRCGEGPAGFEHLRMACGASPRATGRCRGPPAAGPEQSCA